jgi:hypothetical protein
MFEFIVSYPLKINAVYDGPLSKIGGSSPHGAAAACRVQKHENASSQ